MDPVNLKPKGLAEFDIVPPGPIHRSKKLMLAKFLQSAPGFGSKPVSQWKLHPEKQKQATSKASRAPTGPSSSGAMPWVLEKDGEVVQRGVPDGPTRGITPPSAPTTSHTSSYFMFSKHGSTITAFPVDDLLNFKPLPRRPGAQPQTLETAELAMRSGRNVPDQADLRLVPKSVKEAALKNAEERGGLPGRGLGRGGGRGRGKPDQSAILMASLFGEAEDDEDMPRHRRGRGSGGRGRSEGRSGGAAGRLDEEGGALDAQEVPDDIYAGEQDDALRPAKPGQAEDWEYEELRDDDDLCQGEDESEKLEDDPGERRKLGIEGGSEEEDGEEDEDEEEKKHKKEQQTSQEEQHEQGAMYEGQEQQAVDTDRQNVNLGGEEDLDLDAMAMDAFGAPPRMAGSSMKRKLNEEETSPAIARQPPRSGAPKRPRNATGVPAEMDVTAPKPAPQQQQPAAPAGEVTAKEIAAELTKAGGGLPLQQIRSIFMPRLKGKSAMEAFKAKLLQVGRSDRGGPDGKMVLVVLKDEWRQQQ